MSKNLMKVHRKLSADSMVKQAIKENEKVIQEVYRRDFLGDKIPIIVMNTMAYSCVVLHDKFGFGHDRLVKFVNECANQWICLQNEYGDKGMDVAAEILKEECNLDLTFVKELLINDFEKNEYREEK